MLHLFFANALVFYCLFKFNLIILRNTCKIVTPFNRHTCKHDFSTQVATLRQLFVFLIAFDFLGLQLEKVL